MHDAQELDLLTKPDFLVAPDGRVLASKYGEHAGDQWSVDEVLALTRAPAVSSVRAAAEVCAR
ncbi:MULTISPECIES: hypothetical protein [Sorangium]|uniref:hypothetical protein n=1 Tax=Sorangium TaxID=39643 RepID=UPI0002DFB010|nr:hypothetical protein [Sorangium cellulosum]